MSDDAIVILREDHKELRREMRAFSRTREVDTARRQELRDHLLRLWADHLEADNHGMYPEVRERVPDLLHDVRAACEWTGLIESLVGDLERLQPYDERFAAKMEVLAELTEHHVDHDENALFPRAREAMGRNDLQTIGRRIKADRQHADDEPADPVSGLVRAILR
jgi:hemerythrin-like domain-containing protein